MTTKLTPHIDEHPIEQAKAHSRAHGESVSERVADYFAIPGPGTEDHGRESSTPLVDSLHGLLKDKSLDEESYKRHLVDKYGL
ncbi:DUF6364 family protein [Candidatus Thiosymbion oneisti]|uniref:DUF6364 family protein n=1 Tax=Candidatus Thiosymbion oneisti TaxID=589554 RepID=UPI001060F107|nr:DUF6364 family protein [Candidatus Thiosymbion oneisti]